MTAWIKFYPAAALLVPLALGRWRTLLVAAAVAGAIGLYDAPRVRKAIENGAFLAKLPEQQGPPTHALKHSIAQAWPAVRYLLP